MNQRIDNHGEWRLLEDGRWAWFGDSPPQAVEKPWRQQLAIIAIAACTILVIPIGVTGIAFRKQSLDRTADNKASIQREANDARMALARERRLRIKVTNELKARDARTCRANEKQDAVIVSLLAAVKNPTPVVQDAIATLEPANEPDCPPFPPGYGP